MNRNPDVFRFIREHIRSVWTLELLLKLKAEPDRRWSTEELVDSLRASDALVAANLAALGEAGLVASGDEAGDGGGFRYQPAAPALAKLCDDLEEIYRVRPVTVIRWISVPDERLKSLADAFKFRGGDNK